MSNFIQCQYGTDGFDEQTQGYVRAERINDMVAKHDTKRYQGYLTLIGRQASGEGALDENDQYREKVIETLPYALHAYERRHEVTLKRDRIYKHTDPVIKIAAAPHAIEENVCGMTVHIRSTEKKYEEAVNVGVTPDMQRHAQAMMLICRIDAWLHLNYWHDLETRSRRLFEHDIVYDEKHAASLEESMMDFLLKALRRSAA